MGFAELLLLSLLVFLLFGPKKTSEIARKVGSAMGQFKRATDELQTQLMTEAVSIMPEKRATIDTYLRGVDKISGRWSANREAACQHDGTR